MLGCFCWPWATPRLGTVPAMMATATETIFDIEFRIVFPNSARRA
jgi:hypothetical protein